jgi:hypothetical protein
VGLARGLQLLSIKHSSLRNLTQGLALGQVLWNEPDNGKPMYWMHVAQVRDQQRAPVDTVMNLRVT